MRKFLIPVVALIALTFSGCSTTFKEVNATGETADYSMELPDYLTEGYDLNKEASLQYQNTSKEVYVIVIDESKSDFVEMYRDILDDYDEDKSACANYAEAQMESIEGNMESVTSKTGPRTDKINGMDAMVYDLTGTQSDIVDGMGFTVAFVEGKETLYMIMTWTYEKDKDKYQADMDKMIASFKEK